MHCTCSTLLRILNSVGQQCAAAASNAYIRADENVLSVVPHTDQMRAALSTERLRAAPVGRTPREVVLREKQRHSTSTISSEHVPRRYTAGDSRSAYASSAEQCPRLVRTAATTFCELDQMCVFVQPIH